jgi:hypothetical protein
MIARLLASGLAIGLAAILTAVAAGAGAAEWCERRPSGEPAWAHVDVLWFHWRLPDGLAAQDARDRAALGTAQAALRSARDALARQSAAALALQRDALQRQAAGRAAVTAAATAVRGQVDAARRIAAEPAPPSADELTLCRAADRVLKEAAQ